MLKKVKKGSVTIVMAVAIVVLCAVAAYVVDIGLVYAERIRLSNAMDAAALAGVVELPGSSTDAVTVAKEYLVKNGVNPDSATITVNSENSMITVTGNKQVNHLFAPVIGIDTSTVDATAKAKIGPIKTTTGNLRPFGVEMFDFTYGDKVTLKQGAGDSYSGNYNVIALGGTGASTFEENALYGYDGDVSIGDYIDTEPGNMSGVTNTISNYINSETSTFENFEADSIRLWTIPLVTTMEVNGRKVVLVEGFAQFYVESTQKKSGSLEITGKFVRFVSSGEIDDTIVDTGAYGVKLVK